MPATLDFARATRQSLTGLGLCLATPAEIVEGREIARRAVGPAVATVETLQAVQDATGCSSFAYREPNGRLGGVLCIIPLGRAAVADLAAGRLDGLNPPPGHVARPGERVIAVYGWGMAGVTWRGRAVVMAGALRIHREIFDTVPLYGRAATPGGERALLRRMGAHAVPGPGGLVVCPPWTAHRKAA